MEWSEFYEELKKAKKYKKVDFQDILNKAGKIDKLMKKVENISNEIFVLEQKLNTAKEVSNKLKTSYYDGKTQDLMRNREYYYESAKTMCTKGNFVKLISEYRESIDRILKSLDRQKEVFPEPGSSKIPII